MTENQLPKLTKKQKVETLKNIVTFLSNYDRVPGSLTRNWSDMLQSLVIISENIAQFDAEDEATAVPPDSKF